ncbi:hypothetical protein ACOMHN_010871 [Nucella lapillus]
MVKEGDSGDSGTDGLHTKWILDAVEKIRNQKQRPNAERICHALHSQHKVPHDDALQYLEVAVKNGSVLQVYNKGVVSYRDPSKVSQLQSHSLNISPSTDLLKVLVRCIRELGEASGSTLRTLENYIRSSYNVHVEEGASLSSVLKLQAKRAVNEGQLQQEGALFKVALPSPKKKTDLISRIKKTRVTVDVEDIGIGSSEVILPFERNKPTHKPNLWCTYCSKADKAEELVSCADCGNSGHPECLQLNEEVRRRIANIRWQCIECKMCAYCGKSGKDTNMLFCDGCDRAYHFKCCDPEITKAPKGPWACNVCDPENSGEQGQRFHRSAQKYTLKLRAQQMTTSKQKLKNAR